jgi:signal transduction histidine kinase
MNSIPCKAKETKILIVDDTPANLDVLKQTLAREGYRISLAPSGERALKIVPLLKPDLILLDVMMPGIDGYETCRRLKRDRVHADIPVIFITAKNETQDIVEGFNAGGIDYISKPFRHEEVLARVSTQSRIRSLERARQRLTQDLDARNKHLVELNDLKTRFLGMAAHDMRTPLASIGGFSQILIDGASQMSEPEKEDFLTRIRNLSRQMLGMINDLLDVTVIESGQLNLDLIERPLSETLLNRLPLFELLADKKNILIDAQLETLPPVPFDECRIHQVFDNLLGNAVKFSPAGSRIVVSLDAEGDFARVTVRDEGPGLCEADKNRLFDGFQKLNPRPTGGEKSTGLGLIIARKMVEAHGGKLTVESAPGKGSIFGFMLPLIPKTAAGNNGSCN